MFSLSSSPYTVHNIARTNGVRDGLQVRVSVLHAAPDELYPTIEKIYIYSVLVPRKRSVDDLHVFK